MTDDELVARARQGDSHAFGELVLRHQSAVVRTAFVVCRSREDAQDIAQDAFVLAWRRLGSFRGDAQFRTWLLTITWRHALSRRGSAWSRVFRMSKPPEEAAFELGSEAAGADRTVIAGEALDRVREAVARLPPKLRDPLLLAASGECTFEEMSRMLGVPSGTLKWRVMEARRRVKERLEALERR